MPLKETCRAVGGGVPLWRWHRARLAAGGVPEAVLGEAQRLVEQAAAGWVDVPTKRARLTLVVGPDGSLSVDVAQRLSSIDVPNGLLVARVDVAELPPLPRPAAKPADRGWWDAAHKRARALGAHQAVIVDAHGNVVDGSTAAIWIAENGVLVTPPAGPAIPSVSVAFVRELAESRGVDVRVEPLSWERFSAAEEAFVTNAFGGVAPVRGREGVMCAAVRAMFGEVWHSASPPQHGLG